MDIGATVRYPMKDIKILWGKPILSYGKFCSCKLLKINDLRLLGNSDRGAGSTPRGSASGDA
jgi:hypothetical protein